MHTKEKFGVSEGCDFYFMISVHLLVSLLNILAGTQNKGKIKHREKHNLQKNMYVTVTALGVDTVYLTFSVTWGKVLKLTAYFHFQQTSSTRSTQTKIILKVFDVDHEILALL